VGGSAAAICITLSVYSNGTTPDGSTERLEVGDLTNSDDNVTQKLR